MVEQKKDKASSPSTEPAKSAGAIRNKKATSIRLGVGFLCRSVAARKSKRRRLTTVGKSGFQTTEILKRLEALEKKVDTLQPKAYEMPYHKEELLNAALDRVRTLEAELVDTKRALHDALGRQQELLDYIDCQEQAKLQRKRMKERRITHPYIPYYLRP